MRKALSLLVVAIIMLGFTGCDGNGANSPQAAVEAAYKAMKNGDAKAMAAVACDRQGNPMEELSASDEAAFRTASAVFAEVDYTVGDAEYSDDGNRAEVTVTMKILGREETDKITCFKGEDGKWRVKLY